MTQGMRSGHSLNVRGFVCLFFCFFLVSFDFECSQSSAPKKNPEIPERLEYREGGGCLIN